ncbi:MAG: glycolate oxidase iron-sulfur subunit, partial [Gammaproteobacteria bacterium]|nr:glycolate oxidase iron-sulfur subunit [Gammaproteobacteria bacterium]
ALILRPLATRKKIIKADRNQDKTGKAVGLVAGCVQQVIGKDINSASIRLLQRRGWRVHLLSEQACCGAVEHHLGKEALAEKRFRQNITDWIKHVDELGLEALIVNASGCGTMLKDYGHLFRVDESLAADACKISAMTRDIAEFLSEHRDVTENGEMEQVRVAYQSPCSMQHGQKIDTQPVELLRHAGFTVQELPEKYMCCGSAGTYNILQPAIAAELGTRKAACIDQADVDVVASGNMACMMHLRQFTDVPFVHTAELLDWATGGPKPF